MPEATPLTLPPSNGDDIPASGIAATADAGGAFDFLDDVREVLYSESDGDPV